MSIRTRLIFTLSMLLALMTSQVIITVSLTSRIANLSKDITAQLVQIKRIDSIYDDLNSLNMEVNSLTHASSNRNLKELESDISAFYLNYTGSHEKLTSFKTNYNEFTENFKLFLLTESNHSLVANKLNQSYRQVLQQVKEFQQESTEQINDYSLTTQQVVVRTRYLLSIALFLVTVIEVVLGWYLARSISKGLNTLLAATRKVAQGDFSHPINWSSKDEFGYLVRAFNAMLRSLQITNEENVELHKKTIKINEERIRLLRERLSQTVKAQEDERQRVARELHDQGGQALTGLKLGLARLQKLAPNKELEQMVQELKNLTVSTMEDIHNLSLDLRPSMLDDLGLMPAIRQYGIQFQKRSGIEVYLNLPRVIPRQSGEVEITVFRVIQESLTNTAKHAKASKITITIKTISNLLQVKVEDDGLGFDIKEALDKQGKKSVGLFGIRERVELLNGSFSIKSSLGAGTVLEFTIPLAEAQLSTS